MKSKRAMRRVILTRIHAELEERYDIGLSRETLLESQESLHIIDALLAFRSDPYLDELRSALDRLEEGNYGICISCKLPIHQPLLDADPARRVCPACEQQLVHSPAKPLHQHVSA